MGKTRVFTLGIGALVAALALGGCTYNKGPVVTPGASGVVLAGTIAAQMAMQEAELRQSLAGSGAILTNTGSQLRVTLPEAITFAPASTAVVNAVLPTLRVVSDSLKRHPASTVRVIGHTDNVGSAAYATQLSADRAMAVAMELVRNRIASTRIAVSGRGFAAPITSNATEAGRAQNRRVEIVITPTN